VPSLEVLGGIEYDTSMTRRVVIDTNVLVAALRSRRGASFRLLSLLGTGKFDVVLSVPLVVEYEDAMLRAAGAVGLDAQVVGDILDYVCSVAKHQEIFFLWRPLLRDPGDDLVLEVAVAGECEAIVTFNVTDFAGAEDFGLQILKPFDLLRMLGEVP
jgi:putative PIN family toxin of toxin-antitoxin system